MAESFWDDPDAWPPRRVRCGHCRNEMMAPKPTRLHDRVCEFKCPRCGGLTCRVAGDPGSIYCPAALDADCYTPLTIGTGPLATAHGDDDDGFVFLPPPLGDD